MVEVGVDEVGRGCLFGSVVAAAVALPETFPDDGWTSIKDSKKLSPRKRALLDSYIRMHAIACGIGIAMPHEIDEQNILQATMLAMHRALDQVSTQVQISSITVDGNYFKVYHEVPFECVVKGDTKVLSIAAASIIAKVFRDNMMKTLVTDNPDLQTYGIGTNMGYPTQAHIEAIRQHGLTDQHRKSFVVKSLL
ncbi:ribonuclease HII [Tribonema minus]|uniref:Ribonuclease n=1 Tax=Tribonema minus TaxID=303371 RepID=A0A835Z5Q4_9STRA|nr:ribonuclease HII [Tribonema minus]